MAVGSDLKSSLVEYSSLSLKDPDFDCDLPSSLNAYILSPSHWYSLEAGHSFNRPLVWIIHCLEADTTPISATVACFFFIKKHLLAYSTHPAKARYRTALKLDADEIHRLLKALDRRWLRIRHPILYVAFMLDPLFKKLRLDSLTPLGNENI